MAVSAAATAAAAATQPYTGIEAEIQKRIFFSPQWRKGERKSGKKDGSRKVVDIN